MVSRVVVAGAGMAGFTAARRLERMTDSDVEITVVDPTNSLVYPPLLPEVAGGTIEPRHAVSSLRAGLTRSRFVLGEACQLADTASETDDRGDGGDGHRGPGSLTVKLADGAQRSLPFDHLMVAFGSVSRLLPIPGLIDMALGFTTLAEARYSRERVIERLEVAAAATDPDARRRALTFVVVGGGYTGVEAIGELQELSRATAADIPGLEAHELRWCMVEATDKLLAMVSPKLAQEVINRLRARAVELHLETVVEKIEGTEIHLSDGTVVDADTLWWCAGVLAHPALAALGLPADDKGRVPVDSGGAVTGRPGIWAAGDGAAFPDLVGGGLCPPSAQYAVRQGRQVADNIARALQGQPPLPLRYRSRGELLTLGRRDGVAEVYGRQFTGWKAWYLRRMYHLIAIPTWRRKARLWLDWTANLWFPTETVNLADLSPREPVRHAARTQHLLDEAEPTS